MKDKFSTNLLVSSLVFTLLVSMYVFFGYFDDRQELECTILAQQEEIADKDMIIDSFGELAMIYPENRAMVVAIAMTESHCNYDVVHPDSKTKGIGGIKDIWNLECEVNSLMAIEEVIEQLRELYPNDSDYNIIRRYKGGVKNLKSTNKTFEIYTMIKSLFK